MPIVFSFGIKTQLSVFSCPEACGTFLFSSKSMLNLRKVVGNGGGGGTGGHIGGFIEGLGD